jgi:hypothetical protein
MSYQDNVRAASAALSRGEDANWELARLTFEVCGDAGPGRPTQERVGLRQWASDVSAASGRRFGYDAARHYRDIWVRFGNDAQGRHSIPWTDAYSEIRGGSVGERMVEADFKRAMTNATPEQKREAFATLAHEPEVISDQAASTAVFKHIAAQNPAAVQTAWEDTDTNIALSTARWQAREHSVVEPSREAHAETKHIFEPQDTAVARTTFFYGVQKRVEQWTQELNDIREFLAQTDDVNAITRWSTRNALEELIRAAKACSDVLPASYVEEQADEVVTAASTRQRRQSA